MIVVVDAGTAGVEQADDLKRLAVIAPAAIGAAGLATAIGTLGRVDDDGEHIWLDIAELRARAAATQPVSARDAWSDSFDAMIDFAASKGWTDASGAAVRAHLERR